MDITEKYQPEPPALQSAKFEFTQQANCLDNSNIDEVIEIECLADIGIDNNGSCFYKIKTEGWSFDNLDELKALIDRIEKSIKK